jgi:hypothetical protein
MCVYDLFLIIGVVFVILLGSAFDRPPPQSSVDKARILLGSFPYTKDDEDD